MARIIEFSTKYRKCWVCTKDLNDDCVVIKRDEYLSAKLFGKQELIYMFCSSCFDNKKYLLKNEFISDTYGTCYTQLVEHFPELYEDNKNPYIN